MQILNPVRDGDNIHHNHEEKGAEHAGRRTRFRTAIGILILHDTIYSREIEFSEPKVDLSNREGLGSPVDPIHATNTIEKPSVVEMRVDYGFHA